jgi:hypothetical protein
LLKRRIGNHVKIVSCRATVNATNVSIEKIDLLFPFWKWEGKIETGVSQETCLEEY